MTARTTIHYEHRGYRTNISLTPGQREVLRKVAEEAPHWREGICPRRYLKPASSTSLVRFGLLNARNYPVHGYQLTARGKAVVAALATASDAD